MEKDLSMWQKFLDILLVREDQHSNWHPQHSPDGFAPNDLRAHNLISFKSFQESFNSNAAEHLVACISDYRYWVQAEKRPHSGTEPELLPNDQLQTITVTAQYPRKLADELGANQWQSTSSDGVYEMKWGTRPIRVIVCRRVEIATRNALWLLFSGDEERVAFAMQHFGLNNQEMSTILTDISETYQLQGLNMPYTIEDYKRECIEKALESIKTLPADEQEDVLEQLPADLRLRGLDAKDRLEGLDAQDRLEGLDAKDRLEGLDAKDLFEGLSTEELEELRKLINDEENT